MATYLILNMLFLIAALIVLRFLMPLKWSREVKVTLLILVILTAVFDSLIIAADIVAYDTTKILPIRIGFAPIEDFFYTLAVALVVPTLWKGLKV